MTRALAFLGIDWVLVLSALFLTFGGLVTMQSFGAENMFFDRQVVWIMVACTVFFLASFVDYRFLRERWVVTVLFASMAALLLLVFAFGEIAKGAQSRFDLGFFAAQPAELAKLALVIILAKYFARRHVAIANFRHIFISGLYALTFALLIFVQPDFGSALIISMIWFGMVLVAGISWKHLLLVVGITAIVFSGMWFGVLQEYQKERVRTFLNPLTDIQGAGYNAYQATIAVGSGEWVGKGIGYGTQSKLQFLPEYETDFIFAAFAEEWGFVGVVLLCVLFAVLIMRLVSLALLGETNFETLFIAGVAVLLVSSFTIHVGMNIGLLPVTGTTIPFMSYGGSHLITEFLALGMVVGMSRYARAVSRASQREIENTYL